MKALPDSQRRLLDFLLSRPEGVSLQELALHLGVTKSAAKEHLLKVIALGYVTFNDTRGSVGRPKRRYLLSADGHEVFPRQYSWLSNTLLEVLANDLGAQGVAKIMGGLARHVVGSMADRFSRAASPAALLTEVTGALNDLGYRATLRQSDLRKGAIVEATNCVYHSVAKRHPELCQFDIQFLKNATKLDVKLEACIARGDSVCRFCLKKPSA